MENHHQLQLHRTTKPFHNSRRLLEHHLPCLQVRLLSGFGVPGQRVKSRNLQKYSTWSVVSCRGHPRLAWCWTHCARLFLVRYSILLHHHRDSRLPGEEKRSMKESSEAFIGQNNTMWQHIRLYTGSMTKYDEGCETQWCWRDLFEWPKPFGFPSHGQEKTTSFLVKRMDLFMIVLLKITLAKDPKL